MARATWKGVLQISRVAIPIKVYPATEDSEGLKFNQLHADCQSRITQRKWCLTCGREVPSAEIVKGFEVEKDRYVLILDAELDAVQPPSTRVIDLTRFAEADALDPLYIDRSYYLTPDVGGAEAFAVLREAMRGRVGIGKLAIYGREYLVAVRPLIQAVLLHTLHHAAEIRQIDDDPELVGPVVSVDPKQVRLARQVIDALEQEQLHLADFTDAYRDGLRQLIAAKIAGEEFVVAPPETPAVLNLREALQQSLAAVSVVKRSPAKAATPAKRKRAS